jgi:FMN phosphatase YigB (HAD superfamily)
MSTPPRNINFHSLQAIVTDVDGTLYDQRQLRRRMLASLVRAYLAKPMLGWKTARCLQAFRQAQEEIRLQTTADTPHPQAQYARTERTTGYPAAFVRAAVTRWMEQEPLSHLPTTAAPGVREFFSWAARRGLRLAASSDYPLEQKLQALQLADLFPVTVSASDDHVLRFKPHPAILECALQRLGVEPRHAIYLGDRPEVDGAVAKRVGTSGVIISHGKAGRRGWYDDLLYVRSFSALRSILETSEKRPER